MRDAIELVVLASLSLVILGLVAWTQWSVPTVDLDTEYALAALPDTTECRTVNTYPWPSGDSTVVMILCGGVR